LEELANLFLDEAPELYPEFSDRLVKVRRMTSGIGWGFYDIIEDITSELEGELGPS
jgi:hypothetical protein